ncbi:hypothetical protein AX16_006474 [Volvariella volvacea WC 439]|nr:hypothetical protein AX16_006474 [Volvariella volvacea WC 439]
MSDVQAVLSALDVFSRAPDKASLDRANAWLQDFQHSPEAWTACNVLLLSPDAPPAAKLFAAQTFRTKVTYDLHQVDLQNRSALRDTLLAALERYQNGPRTIVVQLCLAITGIALQLPAWANPVQALISAFGRNPATVPVLLQFLTILPEEVTTNTKIPITDDEYNARSITLLSDNSKQVLELLSMYIQAPGVTAAVQVQVFQCLRSWLVAGEVPADDLSKTPLFAFAFEALASDSLFDAAVEVLCELIHETQEIQDNMPIIELIVPEVIKLKPRLYKDRDDPEKIRGYARIFAEAGETYRTLIVQHPETFFPIVEAIMDCSAYHDLDIVPITFQFWMRLAHVVVKRPSVSPLFHEAYRNLMGVIIEHLRFPPDDQALTGQEADNFRSFRHVMGDTLKDCCYVLQADDCLLATYERITTALTRGPVITWQEIEAPLFAMRSMGAEVDPNNQPAVAKILDLIPSLPLHPRVRYAALLIISRYTEWINMHPAYIEPALQYIAAGFEDTDPEVLAAAGQALKYLCQDCKERLVDVLPTLHNFLNTTGSKLGQDEKRQVYEAIAYVISAMPMERAASSLRSFSIDILAQVHDLTGRSAPPSRQELQQIGGALENLEVMLDVIKGFGEQLPAACENTCGEAWAVLDSFLLKYGSDIDLAERVTRVLRHALNLFGSAALPIAASVVKRMSTGFEATGYPSFLWIVGKMVGRFGNEENAELRAAFYNAYEVTTHKMVLLLQSKVPAEIPDVLEDYVHMILQYIDLAPDSFFESLAFHSAFQISLSALSLIHTDIIFAALELFRNILTHDCLQPLNGQPPPPKFPVYAVAIRSVVSKEGYKLVAALLSGLVGDFPEDSTSLVVTIFRMLAAIWPTELGQWLPPVLQHLPDTTTPPQAKMQFLTDVSTAINNGQHDKVKFAILALNRASRKARERRRAAEVQAS